jgi:hypothetical protein
MESILSLGFRYERSAICHSMILGRLKQTEGQCAHAEIQPDPQILPPILDVSPGDLA